MIGLAKVKPKGGKPGKGPRKAKGLRIVQVCIRFPPAPGGVETHVLEISKRLRARGHDVSVITTDLYTETPMVRLEAPFDNVEGIPVKRFPAHTLGGEAHYLFTPAMLKGLLDEGADLVHAHGYGQFHVTLAGVARRLSGTPMVLTAHFHPDWSMWGGERRRGLRRIYDKVFGKGSLKPLSALIVHSNNELRMMTDLGFDEKKARVIPAGVDLSAFTPPPEPARFRDAFGIRGRFVLFSGRLAVNKGLETLVRAMSLVRKEVPGVSLVLVGEDHGMRERLMSLSSELGIAADVVLTGHVDDADVFRSAYSACEVFCLPSEYEAFGLVLVEAMACGRPCVATHVGGIPDVVEDSVTGILVEHKDHEALAEALVRLLRDDGLRRRMGEVGRKRVEERFSWDKIVDDLEKVYRECLG